MGPDTPYHTISWEYTGQREVYHDWDACPDGKRIQKIHRTPGRGGRVKRCLECVKLG